MSKIKWIQIWGKTLYLSKSQTKKKKDNAQEDNVVTFYFSALCQIWASSFDGSCQMHIIVQKRQ